MKKISDVRNGRNLLESNARWSTIDQKNQDDKTADQLIFLSATQEERAVTIAITPMFDQIADWHRSNEINVNIFLSLHSNISDALQSPNLLFILLNQYTRDAHRECKVALMVVSRQVERARERASKPTKIFDIN